MAIPDVQTIPEWEWVKIAGGVIKGSINRLSSPVYYYQTYRLEDETAPTAPTIGTIPEEAVRMFQDSDQELIESSDPIDVYIMCANADDDSNEVGKIRVNL